MSKTKQKITISFQRICTLSESDVTHCRVPLDGLPGTYFALGVSKVNREHRCFHLERIHPEFIMYSNSFRRKVDSSPERQKSVEGCQSSPCFVGAFFKLGNIYFILQFI